MPLPGCHNSGNYLNCASIAIMENTLFGLFSFLVFLLFFFLQHFPVESKYCTVVVTVVVTVTLTLIK